MTYVEKEVHPLFGLSALFVFIIFGFLGFIILPIAYLLTQNVVHRCSRCLQKLGEKTCYGLPDDPSAPVSIVLITKPFLDLAFPPRQVLHRDLASLRNHRHNSVLHRLLLLCLHAPGLRLEQQSLIPPQY